MRNSRSRSREFALQGFYEWVVSKNDPAAIAAQLVESEGFSECDVPYFDRLWHGMTREYAPLLAALAPFSARTTDALSPIEKGALVIGAWELLHEPDVPYRVAIDEAVELAKSYGGTDGHKFVNGVLDKLAASARPREASAARA
ncbi:MAG: transcription antitermination factor NusB [Betaproteobacteria bacterium]